MSEALAQERVRAGGLLREMDALRHDREGGSAQGEELKLQVAAFFAEVSSTEKLSVRSVISHTSNAQFGKCDVKQRTSCESYQEAGKMISPPMTPQTKVRKNEWFATSTCHVYATWFLNFQITRSSYNPSVSLSRRSTRQVIDTQGPRWTKQKSSPTLPRRRSQGTTRFNEAIHMFAAALPPPPPRLSSRRSDKMGLVGRESRNVDPPPMPRSQAVGFLSCERTPQI